MITIRKASDRGITHRNWLVGRHSFSFANYHDPNHMGFGDLRVINEDKISPASGFPPHTHQNMEIITYVISGTLQHEDSMGNGSIIKPGEIQRMSAGTGVEHSETNPSATEELHLLQIWILPDQNNITPSYEQKTINRTENQLVSIASPTANLDGAVMVHQNIKLFAGYFVGENSIAYEFLPGRAGWLQVIKGNLNVDGNVLADGDGASIITDKLRMNTLSDAEFLLFDLLYNNKDK